MDLNSFLLRISGWKYKGEIPTEKKYIVISVPHTSMWDYVWGQLCFNKAKVKAHTFIKKEAFFFPLGRILKKMNAKPVNRGRGAVGLVDQVIHHFNKDDEFVVCITPEGTRSLTNRWKRGFYFIATKANVPIYLGLIDYKRKYCAIGERFVPTGDISKDMAYIQSYYKQVNPTPKHPKNFTLDFK